MESLCLKNDIARIVEREQIKYDKRAVKKQLKKLGAAHKEKSR